MNLALKYRPKTFSDVVGQKAIPIILDAMIKQNSLAKVLLFTGPSGVGKTSMARIVAAELNPDAKEDVHNRVHPSVLEIDAASNGSVAAIRELKTKLNYISPGNRVVIIDEAHSMSPEAFDVFLNLLEYPPENVTFILCTTEAHNLKAAIRHRCDRYTFKRASVDDISERLLFIAKSEGYDLPTDLLNLIAQRSEGSYRESQMLLEQVAISGIKTVEDYNELHGEIDFGPSLITSCLSGPAAALSQLDSILHYTNSEEVVDRIVEVLRDLTMLKGGLDLSYTGKALDIRTSLAKKLDSSEILKAITIIWDLQTKLSAADPVRGLEMALSMIGSILERKNPVTTNDEVMSLEDLKSYTS